MFFKRRPARIALLTLVIVLNLVVWTALLFPERKTLEVSFLTVGQGDAIYIEGPTGIQVLVDGGRDRSVLRELGKRMGPLDRSLDLVVETHPDADHIGGFAEVFKKYEVTTFMSPGVVHESSIVDALAHAVAQEKGLATYTARRGMRILLGGGAYADILYPDRDVSLGESNAGSIIVRIVYGTTQFFLSGDAPESIEEWVVSLGGELESDVMKAGHHGSRTSTGEEILSAVDPEVVVISAGKDNQYGHPHQEVIVRIQASGATVLSTAEKGTITFMSDGTRVFER